jgi:hypothetical protein
MTRITLLALTIPLLTTLVFAQTDSAWAPACGAPDTKFDVKTDKEQYPAQPETGKALVYFIQDDSEFLSRPRPTTRVAMDGEWLGATRSNSYFYFFAAPGVHHLCTSWQPAILEQRTAATHFTAEAGTVYYFSVKNGPGNMNFSPLDSDERQLLVNQFSFSTSHPKK